MPASILAPPGLYMEDGNKPVAHGYGVDSGNGLSDGLVAHLPFWEGAGSRVQDLVNGNNGTLIGAIWESGENGLVLDFDGSTSWINTPSTNALDGSLLTIAAWVKPEDTLDAFPRVVDRVFDGQFSAYLTTLTTSRHIGFAGKNSVGGLVDYSSLATDVVVFGEWQHIAWRLTGTQIEAYRNGVLVGADTFTGGVADSTDIIRIGQRVDAGNRRYTGQMDQVSIYSRSLSPAEIAELFNNRYQLITPGQQVFAPAAVGVVSPYYYHHLLGA